jgi:hypothetical protein
MSADALGGDSPHIRQKKADVGHPEADLGHTEKVGQSNVRGAVLGWSSLFLAALESICVLAVALSGVRVLLGLSSLIGAASAAEPAHGFHREALRVPILGASGVIAVVNLLLLWNENRIRQNPAAQWRIQPLAPKQRRQRWIQIVTSIGALLLILIEVSTHSWFHHEL